MIREIGDFLKFPEGPLNVDIRPSTEMPWHLNVLLSWIRLASMSGGPNTAIHLTYRLARAGIPVRYISTGGPAENSGALFAHFRQLTGIQEQVPNVEIVSAHDRSKPTPIGEDDVFLGTAWWTVQQIKHILPQTRVKQFLYLIQDYEPGFYPWSVDYALALETYGLPFKAVINESLLGEYLTQQHIGQFANPAFSRQCCIFEPAVDRAHFYPDPEMKIHEKGKRLVFYARPEAPRNLYPLGLAALKQAVDEGIFRAPEWQLVSVGDDVGPVNLGHGVVMRPAPWMSYGDYAAFLRDSDVGLSLMLSPHTSYPPLEMAASGMSVVTNAYTVKNSQRLRQLSSNIVPVTLTLEGIVNGLHQASQRTENRQWRIAGSRVALPGSWDEVFDPLIPTILKMVQECRAGCCTSACRAA